MPLLAIYRQPESLEAVSIEAPEGALMASTLEALSKEIYPRKQILLDAWQALSEVRDLDAVALSNIVIVLVETLSKTLDVSLNLSNLPHEAALRPSRRRREDPKPPRGPSMDLRPYLCDARQRNRLLARMAEYWPEARERMIDLGYEERLPEALPVSDPYLWRHFDLTSDAALPYFPEPFVKLLWPALRGQRWQHVVEWLGLYWALGLDADDGLCRMMACLICYQPDERSLGWARVLPHLLPEQRHRFLRSLFESAIASCDPSWLPAEAPTYLRNIRELGAFSDRSRFLLRAVERKVDPSYVWGGLRLADLVEPMHLWAPEGSSYCPVSVLESFYHRLKNFSGDVPRMIWGLWQSCGTCPELGPLLESHNWSQYSDAILKHTLELCWWHAAESDADSQRREAWIWLCEHLDAIGNALESIPTEYQDKFAATVSRLLDLHLHRELPKLWPTIIGLCAEPFVTHEWTVPILGIVAAKQDDDLLQEFCAASSISFRFYETECCTGESGSLIDDGLKALIAALDRWMIRCFREAPRPLLRVAKLLGTLPKPLAQTAIREFSEHPLLSPAFAHLPPQEIIAYLSEVCREPITNPVPRKLKLCYEGKGTLREGQLRRAWNLLGSNLLISQIDLLEQVALDSLRQNFNVDPNEENVRHALQMRFLIHENRKAFMRFLRAHWEGRDRYLEEHPSNAAWLASRKGIDKEVWKRGIELTREVSAYGTLRLSVEQNPLEALKLGTYVGSCLSLGGINAYSAVAVVLDANKQVIYARSQTGAVVARQLVALSEENELVCFPVYPTSTSSEITAVFRAYDQSFAKALGVKLFRPGQDSRYTILNLLSQSWYDDGAGDFSKKKAFAGLR